MAVSITGHTRRTFLGVLIFAVMAMLFPSCKRKRLPMNQDQQARSSGTARVYRSINGTPQQNMRKVLDLAGGIEKIIDAEDVVIIKPNIQWWNQGTPNIAACAALVDCIMERPGGFSGEVVIGENTHRGNEPWKKTGWQLASVRNADHPKVNNYNRLCTLLKNKYGRRFSVSHWIDVSAGGKRVYGPGDGQGYVYCDGTGGVPLIKTDNGLAGESRREVIMSYPVFITDNGTIVDFKNGIWRDGSYSGQPMKFINLAALNHHSSYCGMTGSVKNYFGITDLSNGANPHNGGRLIGNFYNFHSFAFNEWAKGPVPGMMGAAIGMFMQKIRKADLNIITAEWVGLTSRTQMPVAHTQAILASTDPVALDYHASKYILYSNSQCRHHNPDWKNGPLFQYLSACAKTSGCKVHEVNIELHSYDVNKEKMQSPDNQSVFGKIIWGNNVKFMLKYLLFRFGSNFLT